MSAVSLAGLSPGGCRDSGHRFHDDDTSAGIVTLDDGGFPEATAVETSGGLTERTVLYVIVDPAETVLELDLGASSSLPFTATAVYDDGSSADVTEEVTWEVSNAVVGEMNGSTLEVVAQEANDVSSAVVTAELGERIGRAQLTVASHRLGEDYFFVLPFEHGDAAQAKPLTFGTDIESVDVFVSMDTTASMDAALVHLRDVMLTRIIPQIRAHVPDAHFGAGAFQDFPVDPYGVPGDQPFTLYQEITDDVLAVQLALLSFATGSGGDTPESGFEALYQIATGGGLWGPDQTRVDSNESGIGGVGFRMGALPIVVSITDAIAHDPTALGCGRAYHGPAANAAHGRAAVVEAFDDICARSLYIGLSEGECGAVADGVTLAEETGTVIPVEAWDVEGRPPGCEPGECCTGQGGAGVSPNEEGLCPMSFRARLDGTGIDESFASGVQLIAAYVRLVVTRQVMGKDADEDGVALPAGRSTADFIKAVTPHGHGPSPLAGVPDPVLGPTSFEGVLPGTDVIFEVRAQNDFVEQGPEPRLFEAEIEVLAHDCSELDTRDVLIVVPPAALRLTE